MSGEARQRDGDLLGTVVRGDDPRLAAVIVLAVLVGAGP